MLKVGFVAGAAGYHSVQFAKMFNGMNESQKHLDPFGGNAPMATVEGAEVVKVFDENRSNSELLSNLCNIPNVATNIEEMYEGLDAIFIGDDLNLTQYHYARPFLERGIPTFLDKPIADNVDSARELIDIARDFKSLFMSTSALKYAPEFKGLFEGSEGTGKTVMASVFGPADLMWRRPFLFYGMHAVTIGHYAVDDRPVEVTDVGTRGRTVVAIKYMKGAQVTVMCPHDVPVSFEAMIQGTKGSFHGIANDPAAFYSNMLKDFVKMVEEGEQTFDLLKALEVLQICCAQEESVRSGKPIRLG